MSRGKRLASWWAVKDASGGLAEMLEDRKRRSQLSKDNAMNILGMELTLRGGGGGRRGPMCKSAGLRGGIVAGLRLEGIQSIPMWKEETVFELFRRNHYPPSTAHDGGAVMALMVMVLSFLYDDLPWPSKS